VNDLTPGDLLSLRLRRAAEGLLRLLEVEGVRNERRVRRRRIIGSCMVVVDVDVDVDDE